MPRLLAIFLLAGCAAAGTHSPGVSAASSMSREQLTEHVRQREIGFAAAFANRDKAKFASFIAPDATFFGGPRPIAGRDEVLKAWDGFLSSDKPPFSWRPAVVVVKPTSDLAISLGPIFDASGKETARYSSIWQKQADGEWLVIFDGPGCSICPPAK